MEEHTRLGLLLIIEGTIKKLSQFIIPIKSIYKKNFSFLRKKIAFWNFARRLKQKIYMYNYILCLQNFASLPFQRKKL
jgi:hypothetical protein